MKTVILIGAQGQMGQAALTGLGNHKVITASRSGKDCDHNKSVDRTNIGEADLCTNQAASTPLFTAHVRRSASE